MTAAQCHGAEVSSLGLSPLTPPATFMEVIVPLEENKKNFTPLWSQPGSSECSRAVPVAALEGGFGLGWEWSSSGGAGTCRSSRAQ